MNLMDIEGIPQMRFKTQCHLPSTMCLEFRTELPRTGLGGMAHVVVGLKSVMFYFVGP